jgi:hypothetical protein
VPNFVIDQLPPNFMACVAITAIAAMMAKTIKAVRLALTGRRKSFIFVLRAFALRSLRAIKNSVLEEI